MNRRGMTLIELMVVLGIVATLAALALGALQSTRQSADRTVATNNLRQIGAAIASYTSDNSGSLPGPMWPGQIPVIDPSRSGRLVADLAPFLGLTNNTLSPPVSLFIPPAYRKVSTDLTNARTFVLNMFVPSGDSVVNPWGSLATSEGAPMKLAAIPATAWAMSDADQQHPHVTGAPWAANTPAKPIHSPRRMALTFSGAVVFPDNAELAKP